MATPKQPGISMPPTNPMMPVAGWLSLLPPDYVRAFREGKITLDFFTYTADFLPITAGASSQVDIAITADSDFLILYSSAWITDTASPPVTVATTSANLTVTLRDTGSGRALSSNAVPVSSMFGTAQLPHIWVQPKLIGAASTFSVICNSLDTVSRNARFAFMGAKIFAFSS
jgi:hypothetical protein